MACALAADLAALHPKAADVLVVSSGSIASALAAEAVARAAQAGGKARPPPPSANRAGSVEGQGAGAARASMRPDIVTCRTPRSVAAISTPAHHPKLWVALHPVINENDSVPPRNPLWRHDRLAARVAPMTSADLLILLSDMMGRYDAPPGTIRMQS